MVRYWECRSCRALLTRERLEATGGLCPYCDARVGDRQDFADPEAPPAPAGARGFAPMAAPASLAEKLATAFRLLVEQLPLLALLVWMVKLPANAAVEAVVVRNPGLADDLPRLLALNFAANLLVGPICSAAVIYALADRMSGRTATFRDAARAGFDAWPRVFAARLLCMAGVLAASAGVLLDELPQALRILCLIPGLVLSVRWSLIDEVMVLEDVHVLSGPRRSTELVTGRAWKIVAASAAALLCIGLFSKLVMQAFAPTGVLDEPLARVLLGSVLDVFALIHPILLFLFYWEARAEHDGRPAFKPAFEEERL